MARRKLVSNTRGTGPRVTLSCADMHGLTFNAAAVEKYRIADREEVLVYYDDELHAFVLERVASGTAGALAFRRPQAKYAALRLTLRGAVAQIGLLIPDSLPVDVELVDDEIIVKLTPDMTIE